MIHAIVECRSPWVGWSIGRVWVVREALPPLVGDVQLLDFSALKSVVCPRAKAEQGETRKYNKDRGQIR